MPFQGQHVYVMGGSYGVGEATARAFAAAGANVVITSRSKQRLDAAAARIGPSVQPHTLDATDPGAVTAFFENIENVDHLVLALSPGAVAVGPLASLEEKDLRTAFDGKFFAHVRVLQAAAPHLSRDGSVTFLSAASARSATPGTAGLAAANGAIEAMVPPLAAELAPVRVNAVSPGIIDTNWWDGMPADQKDAYFQGVAATSPVGRVGHPDDVAGAILYLAGNTFITGTVLDVSGGLTLARG
jgi:NAD(P)-dependent dehydrogenase (short-subunit alcohol dehydrogenase family)